jgi:translocon-associated protein subunit gamma
MVAKGKSQPRTSKKEEEALIKMFSRDVSNKGQASFFVNALLAAATPVFLFARIQQVDLSSAWHVMAVFTCATAYVLQYTYAKAKFGLKQKMAGQIHEGITREVNNSMSAEERKKVTAQQKDDRILRRKNEIADKGATQQAVFQTNVIYFFLVLLASFGLFGTWEPIPNFIASAVFSTGLIGLLAAMEK